MAITTQSFLTLVRQQAAAIQSKAAVVLSFVVGSIELARVEATAAVAMWLQSIVLELLATTRLSTSTGTDADSFVADFQHAAPCRCGGGGRPCAVFQIHGDQRLDYPGWRGNGDRRRDDLRRRRNGPDH